MRKRVAVIWVSWILILGCAVLIIDRSPLVEGATITVDDGGLGDYLKIQDAINASKDGDTVFVFNGTYYENIVINKTINLLGEDRNNTIIDGSGSGDVILVTSGWVNVSGFSVRNSGNQGGWAIDAGLEILSGNNTISENIFYNNNCDLYLYSSNDNRILNNIINSIFGGIFLRWSSNNNIEKNNISNAAFIRLSLSSNNNTITNNIIVNGSVGIDGTNIHSNKIIFNKIIGNGSGVGISISDYSMPGPGQMGSYDHLISNNIISNNHIGISLQVIDAGGIGVDIFFSIITDNEIGIDCGDSGGVIQTFVSNCTFEHNNKGIHTYQLSGINNIINNNFSNNRDYAIYLNKSHNIVIHHNNFIKNGQVEGQVFDNTDANIWDDSYPSGGNFWSDYTGVDQYNGPAQNILGNDGIGDTPHIIDSDSQDNYPLKYPIGDGIYLYQGWNLVSIPFIQPDTDLEMVLNPIEGSYDAVQWYDTSDSIDKWKDFHISKPFPDELDNLNHTIGFWIHVTEPDGVLFEFLGTQPIQNQNITIQKGWNLVGYPSLSRYNRSNGLNNIGFGTEVDAVQWYDSASKSWHLMGDNDIFIPGKGYWVHSKVDTVWDVPL
jgi:parallel beta-helix repeat protein